MSLLSERDEAIILFETYGSLLTKTQQEIFLSHYSYDLSFSEISEDKGISRAAISDSISKSLAKMKEYEEKLGIIRKHTDISAKIADIEKIGNDAEKLSAYIELGEELKNGI